MSTLSPSTDGGRRDARVPDSLPIDAAVPSAGCVPNSILTAGRQKLLGAYLTAAGVIVVRTDAIQIIARDRTVLKTVMAPRTFISSAFDGTNLVVSDGARLNFYDASATFQDDLNLPDTCPTMFIVNGGVLVCGPTKYDDRTFYTFNIPSRSLLKTIPSPRQAVEAG